MNELQIFNLVIMGVNLGLFLITSISTGAKWYVTFTGTTGWILAILHYTSGILK